MTTTHGPFVIIENARVGRGSDPDAPAKIHPALDPAGILRPAAVLPAFSKSLVARRGNAVGVKVNVRLLVAFDYPGRVSA